MYTILFGKSEMMSDLNNNARLHKIMAKKVKNKKKTQLDS